MAHILRIDYPFAFFSFLLFSRLFHAHTSSVVMLQETQCRFLSRLSGWNWVLTMCWQIVFQLNCFCVSSIKFDVDRRFFFVDILTTLLTAFVPSLPINYVFFASLHSQSAENIFIANNFYLLVVQERLWSASENALCKGLINGLMKGTRLKLTKCHLRMHS